MKEEETELFLEWSLFKKLGLLIGLLANEIFTDQLDCQCKNVKIFLKVFFQLFYWIVFLTDPQQHCEPIQKEGKKLIIVTNSIKKVWLIRFKK